MNILWDFDGTLFDTYPAYTNLLSQVLGDKVDRQEIYEKLKVSYSHAIQFYNISAQQEVELKVLRKNLSPKDIKPFENVEDVLKFADKNVIMTHKHREGVLAILEYYGWDQYFVDMVTIDDGFPRKPDPASYSYLHTKHGIDLAIGDRELDLLPAKELGISTCIFQGYSAEAEYRLEHYSDFLKIKFEKMVGR
ncbi:HAD-IA family hydrolase [Neobacillus sp. Marseille-QA0830]